MYLLLTLNIFQTFSKVYIAEHVQVNVSFSFKTSSYDHDKTKQTFKTSGNTSLRFTKLFFVWKKNKHDLYDSSIQTGQKLNWWWPKIGMLIKIDPLGIHLTRLHDDQSNHTDSIKLLMKEFPYLCLNAKQLSDKIYDLWASN